MRRVPSFCNRPGFPAGLQVLLLPCTSLPATDVAASVQLLREAAYEVVVSEDWKKGMALVTRGSPSGHSFDVVLAEAADFFASLDLAATLRAATETQAVVLLAPSVEPNMLMKAIKAGAMDVLPVPCPQRGVAKLWQLSVRKRMEQAALSSAGQPVGRPPGGASLSSGPDGSGCAAGNDPDKRGRSYTGGSSGGVPHPPALVTTTTGGGGLSKEKKGPSWTSMLILPQPEVSQAMAASAQAMGPVAGGGSGGHHHEGGCPSASAGSTGRVTRPRSRLTSSASGLQLPGRWGTRGGTGAKQGGQGGGGYLGGGDADFLTASGFGFGTAPAPGGPGSLPGWCLGPLGDADLMILGGADYEDALLAANTDFDVATLGLEEPYRPASAPPVAAHGPALPGLGPLATLPQLGVPLLPRSDSGFTSMQAQVEQLQQEVAREAACLLATAAAAKLRPGGAEPVQSGLTSAVEATTTTTAWTADGISGGDGSSSPNTSGSAAGSSATLAFGPLGLKLRKSESLLDLVAMRCSAGLEAPAAEAPALLQVPAACGGDAMPLLG